MPIYRNDISSKDLPHINRLLHVLSENAHDLSELQLESCLRQKNFEVVSARNERLMYAVATVHFSGTLNGCYAYIDDVVVDPNVQSKGLGTAITKELILMAKERGAKWVGLTSAPKRVAANIIYSRLMERLWSARILALKTAKISTSDLSSFLDYSNITQVVDPRDVYVVDTLMGRKAFISNDVIKKYPPASVLEMVWIAIAQGADSIEIVVDRENEVVADLLLERRFIEKETNAYKVNL